MAGYVVVTAALAALVGAIIRGMWRGRKAGARCTGNCATCGGCHGAGPKKSS